MVALFATADGGPKEDSFERTEESSSGLPGIETPNGEFESGEESRCELAGSSATELFRVFFLDRCILIFNFTFSGAATCSKFEFTAKRLTGVSI